MIGLNVPPAGCDGIVDGLVVVVVGFNPCFVVAFKSVFAFALAFKQVFAFAFGFGAVFAFAFGFGAVFAFAFAFGAVFPFAFCFGAAFAFAVGFGAVVAFAFSFFRGGGSAADARCTEEPRRRSLTWLSRSNCCIRACASDAGGAVPAINSTVVLAVATAGCAMAVGAAVTKVFPVVIAVVTASNCGIVPHDALGELEKELD